MNELVCVIFGVGCGFGLSTLYYRWCRLIRTKHEWYSDPVISRRYPEEAKRALEDPDTW